MQPVAVTPSEVEDPEQALIVQAFLSPDQEVAIRLRQTLPADKFFEGLEDTVITAHVSLVVDDETFVLTEDAEEPGTYRIDRQLLAMQSGKTYRLAATLGERQLRATTSVPIRS